MESSVDFTFEASHVIPDHPGKCRKLHGHRWVVTVTVTGDEYDWRTGTVVDVGSIRKMTMPIVARLDHSHLNFFMSVPTAENVALYFAHEISAKLGSPEYVLRIEVSDTFSTKVVLSPAEKFNMLHPPRKTVPGWRTAYADKILAFSDIEARVRWVGRTKRMFTETMAKLNDLGAQLAEFDLYAQSLDPSAAAELLAELKKADSQYEVTTEEV